MSFKAHSKKVCRVQYPAHLGYLDKYDIPLAPNFGYDGRCWERASVIRRFWFRSALSACARARRLAEVLLRAILPRLF